MVHYGETGDAVRIVGATSTPEGTQAEYDYIAQKLGERGCDWAPLTQSLTESEGAQYDEIEVEVANGKKRTFRFDVSEFFGIELQTGEIGTPGAIPPGRTRPDDVDRRSPYSHRSPTEPARCAGPEKPPATPPRSAPFPTAPTASGPLRLSQNAVRHGQLTDDRPQLLILGPQLLGFPPIPPTQSRSTSLQEPVPPPVHRCRRYPLSPTQLRHRFLTSDHRQHQSGDTLLNSRSGAVDGIPQCRELGKVTPRFRGPATSAGPPAIRRG